MTIANKQNSSIFVFSLFFLFIRILTGFFPLEARVKWIITTNAIYYENETKERIKKKKCFGAVGCSCNLFCAKISYKTLLRAVLLSIYILFITAVLTWLLVFEPLLGLLCDSILSGKLKCELFIIWSSKIFCNLLDLNAHKSKKKTFEDQMEDASHHPLKCQFFC